jgi:hypothetical protein
VVKGERVVMVMRFGVMKWGEREMYRVKEGDRLAIWEMGESRMSNTNYYYSVRVVGKDGSWNVIKRDCMFDARTAVMKLAHELQIPFSTKIVPMKTTIEE